MKSILFTCVAALALSAICLQADDQKKEAADAKPAAKNEVAVIKTSAGEMVIQFWSDAAPKTIANFKTLARKGFYDGTAFHRIIPGFMIQGGDPKTKDPANGAEYGTGGPGFTIEDEFNSHPHEKGVISMANTGQPHSAGCQFFICLAPQPRLDGGYTTFGKVIKGEDILQKLGDSPITLNPFNHRENSWPKDRVSLESVKIVPADSIK